MKLRTLALLVAAGLLTAPAHSNILISEVLYDAPNNDTTEEFVELYNDTCSAVSLSGYSLADLTYLELSLRVATLQLQKAHQVLIVFLEKRLTKPA
jgi:hypothetical protein